MTNDRLAAFADDRITLGYSTVLILLYVVVLLLFFCSPPLGGSVLNTIIQPDIRAQLGGYSLARLVNYSLFGVVLIPALVTSVRGFVIHIAMLRDVAALPFRNIHTSAQQLEPLVRFSMTAGTAWFAGISLVLLWFRSGIRGYIAVLVLIGVLHIVTPLWILHDALQREQQDLLQEIRADYNEIRHLIREADETPDELSLWLEVTDRRLESAKSISTWVYDVPSLSRLLAASVIPWLTLIERVVTLIPPL